MAQMNYNYGTPKGIAGSKVDISYDEVVTRKNEEEDGILKYGVAVVIGASTGHGVKLPTTASIADNVEGVVLHAENTEQDRTGKVIVKKGASLGIMRKGHVWGRVAEGTTPIYGAKAYVIIDETAGEVGTFTNTATTGKTIDIGAKFGNASDTGIAVIEL